MKLLTLFLSVLLFSQLSYSKECNKLFKEAKALIEQKGITDLNAMPMDKITPEHIEAYFNHEYAIALKNLKSIINSKEAPTFKNTILAIENVDKKLNKPVSLTFQHKATLPNAKQDQNAQMMSEKLNEFSALLSTSEKLYKRVDEFRKTAEYRKLDKQDKFLTDEFFDSLKESGVSLSSAKKERMLEIKQEGAKIALGWSKKVSDSESSLSLHILDKNKLKGVPEDMLATAQQNAKDKNLEGYLLTSGGKFSRSFMAYVEDDAVRKQIYDVYTQVGKNGEFNTEADMLKLLELRQEYAEIMGFEDFASFVTSKMMVKNKETVTTFLEDLIVKTKVKANKNTEDLKQWVKAKYGNKVELKPWNSSYYLRLYKEEKSGLNQNALRKYFEMEQTLDGIFALVKKLYNVEFQPTDLPLPSKEMKGYIVKDLETNKNIGLFYLDIYARDGKRGGAWMNSYIDQNGSQGIRPHISNTLNVSKPPKGKPTLLTTYEVNTLLHELGHGLHGLFSEVRYSSYSGTSVIRDFVEVPSTIMESFLYEDWFLKSFAKHHETGEVIPDELINKIIANKNFFEANGDLSLYQWALMDMKLHSKEYQSIKDLAAFEDEIFERTAEQVAQNKFHRIFEFSHLWSGFNSGYNAGYYLYFWDWFIAIDGFYELKNNNFSREVMNRWRDNILKKGGLDHPMDNYLDFTQGREPNPDYFYKDKELLD